jgi:hypothetical protein
MTVAVQLDYTLTLRGPVSAAAMMTEMAAPPPPTAELAELGCFVLTDVVTDMGTSPVQVRRRLTIAVVPGSPLLGFQSPATATAAIDGGSKSAPIQSLTLTSGGAGYTTAPIVEIGEASSTPPVIKAQAVATIAGGIVTGLKLINPGEGYTTPTVKIVGIFEYTWPDGSGADQRQPFYNLMTAALQTSTNGPIFASAPVVVPWLPTTPAGLILWVQSNLGITQVAAKVSLWSDQSPNGYNVGQTVGADRPVFSASGGPNGMPRVTFVPVSVRLENLVANLIASGSDRTIIVYYTANSPDGGALCCFRTTTPVCGILALTIGPTNYAYSDGATVSDTVAAPTYDVPVVATYTYSLGSQIGYRVNGAPTAVVGGTVAAETGATGFMLGGWTGGGENLDGDMYALLVYDRILPLADILAAELYLQTLTP